MATEIKHRCWDAENKKMWYQDEYNYVQVYLNNKFSLIDSEENVIVSNVIDSRNAYMQYIGWDDINGVEIYYGDIVKYKSDWGDDENEMGTAIVHRYINNGAGLLRRFGLADDNGKLATYHNKVRYYHTYASWNGILELLWYDKDMFELEVVGNIFETPDLVNK